jgi:hypothetical protein
MICEEVKKPENKYEAASTLLGSERPFGQVHLLWQTSGLEEEEEVIQVMMMIKRVMGTGVRGKRHR